MPGPAATWGRDLPRRRPPGRFLAAAFALLFALLAVPGTVLAHAQVVATDPVDGARLPVTPAAVSLTFNEPVTLAPGGLRVVRPDGSVADVGDEVVAGPIVSQPIEPLADGWYVMAWSIISEDGHVVHGSATFAVGDADTAARPEASTFASPLEVTLWLTRGVADLLLLVAAGAAVAWSVLAARTTRVRRLWVAALAVGVAAQAAWLAVELVDGGTAWTTTAYALSGITRLVLLVSTLGLLLLRPPRYRASAVLGVLATVTLAWGGHASGSPLTSLTLALHLLAAVTWLGAAPAVALVAWDRSVEDDAVLVTVRAFSRLATLALVALFAGGTASALLLTNGLENGITLYVWLVLAKVGVVAIAATLGARTRRTLTRAPERRRFRRLFLVDTVLLVSVALLSGALTLVGPHGGHVDHDGHAIASPRCSMTVGDVGDSFGAAFVAAPGRPGTNTLLVSGVPDGVRGVTVQLLHPYAGGASIDVPLTAADVGWTGVAALPFTGSWTATVLVRVDAFTQARGACEFTIAP